MKRTTMFILVTILALGLSTSIFAVDFMKSAQNALKAGDLNLALENAKEGLAESNNSDPQLYSLIGDIYFAKQSYELASKYWTNAVKFKIKEPKKFQAKRAEQMFAIGCRQLDNLAEARRTFVYAIRLGYPVDEINQVIIDYGESILTVAMTRDEGEKAIPYIGQDRFEQVFPPAYWERVGNPITKTGRGDPTSQENLIKIAQSGEDYVHGDKLILSGKSFFVHLGVWKECEGGIEIINESVKKGQFLYVAAPEGMKVILTVQRWIIPPKQEQALLTVADMSPR